MLRSTGSARSNQGGNTPFFPIVFPGYRSPGFSTKAPKWGASANHK